MKAKHLLLSAILTGAGFTAQAQTTIDLVLNHQYNHEQLLQLHFGIMTSFAFDQLLV